MRVSFDAAQRGICRNAATGKSVKPLPEQQDSGWHGLWNC